MYRKILLISGILLTLIIITYVIFYNINDSQNHVISNINKDEEIINNNMITMMYETEAGSGEYTETLDNTWPESGYIFNETLSGCENGGELEYNSKNKTINLISVKSDKCYVYFDKYEGVWIDNVIATNITGSSVTLDVTATSENGNITTYYYSLNDSEYISTNTNPIVIDNLNQLTEYNIKVYAIDNTGARSNIYELNITTSDISIPIINSVSVSNISYDGFTLTVNATSDIEIERYYYIIESENISGTNTTNMYTFANLDDGTNYSISIFAEDVNGTFSNKYNLNVTTDKLSLANYIKSLYISQGSNGLYYHNSSLANGAGDNSYRYAGANPNNYICFGSTASTCPDANLYRIIGVFDDQVKLIMADYPTTSQTGTSGAYSTTYANSGWSTSYYKGDQSTSSIGVYYWNPSGTNTWSSSTLTTTNLRDTFLNTFSSTYQEDIASATWYVNGYSTNSATPATWHDNESTGTPWTGKIGLMYVSDYGFAASNSAWTTNMDSYNSSSITSNNWMYMGLTEWTISRYSSYTYSAYRVYYSGSVSGDYVSKYSTNAVRPSFYLESSVSYASGSGTATNPIRIT